VIAYGFGPDLGRVCSRTFTIRKSRFLNVSTWTIRR